LARATVTVPVSERLAERIENGTLEFRQLVEEQHAEIGKAHLPGRTLRPPPTRAAIDAL
jgi:hypothetical protein